MGASQGFGSSGGIPGSHHLWVPPSPSAGGPLTLLHVMSSIHPYFLMLFPSSFFSSNWCLTLRFPLRDAVVLASPGGDGVARGERVTKQKNRKKRNKETNKKARVVFLHTDAKKFRGALHALREPPRRRRRCACRTVSARERTRGGERPVVNLLWNGGGEPGEDGLETVQVRGEERAAGNVAGEAPKVVGNLTADRRGERVQVQRERVLLELPVLHGVSHAGRAERKKEECRDELHLKPSCLCVFGLGGEWF